MKPAGNENGCLKSSMIFRHVSMVVVDDKGRFVIDVSSSRGSYHFFSSYSIGSF